MLVIRDGWASEGGLTFISWRTHGKNFNLSTLVRIDIKNYTNEGEKLPLFLISYLQE